MFKKITSLAFLLILSIGFFSFSGDNYARAQDDYGLSDTVQEIDAFKNQNVSNVGTSFIQTRAGEIIGLVLSFVGVLFLMLVIYAGILWMTAQGNEQKVTKAKDLLINAVVGLVIVFAAYAITAFVGDFVTEQMLN